MCKGRHCAHNVECFNPWPKIDLLVWAHRTGWPKRSDYPSYLGSSK